MKLKPRSQSTEASQFIKASYASPLSSGTPMNPANLIERLEPDTGMSLGKVIEPILITLASKIVTDLSKIVVERCLIIGVESMNDDLLASLKELCSLAAHSGLLAVGCESQKSGSIADDHVFGIGKIKQIAIQMISLSVDTVVFDGELSPIQLRNLEDSILSELPLGTKGIKVLDKTAIILDIVAQKSHSAESAMQAELAIMLYRLPRMTSMWSKLVKSSDCNSSVGSRGPGTTRTDLNFTQMRKRISYLKKSLEVVRATRCAQRLSRRSKGLPSIALVGYIGSGKTSLFHALSDNRSIQSTRKEEENSPFKTLEAVTRRISVPKIERKSNPSQGNKLSVSRNACPDFVLVDTLSFINKLPQCIRRAFQMNFDELECADIIINVCDISNPTWQENEKSVLSALMEFEGLSSKPLITVWNMVDRFSDFDISRIQEESTTRHQTIAVSALYGIGFDDLIGTINTVMVDTMMTDVRGVLSYSPQNLSFLSKLQQCSSFESVEYTNDGVLLIGKIPLRFASQFSNSIKVVKIKTRAVKSIFLTGAFAL